MDNSWRNNIEFILVEPTEPGNIGASARAIKNMGFRNLGIVNPPEMTAMATWMARNAEDVLESANIYESFEAAAHGKSLLVGTTRRKGRKRGMIMPFDDGSDRILQSSANTKVAVFFGRERQGLSNPETAMCSYLLSIDTDAEHPSLNLSQAVLLVAYELSKRSKQVDMLPSEPAIEHYENLADMSQTVMDIIEQLSYDKSSYRNLASRIKVMLRSALGRAAMNEREIKTLHGICARILRRLKK